MVCYVVSFKREGTSERCGKFLFKYFATASTMSTVLTDHVERLREIDTLSRLFLVKCYSYVNSGYIVECFILMLFPTSLCGVLVLRCALSSASFLPPPASSRPASHHLPTHHLPTHNLHTHTTYTHTHSLHTHTTYTHTQLTHTHTAYTHTHTHTNHVHTHTTCSHTTSPHTYSHTTSSHTTYPHTTYPHTTYPHPTYPHTTYLHTTYSHATYSHTTFSQTVTSSTFIEVGGSPVTTDANICEWAPPRFAWQAQHLEHLRLVLRGRRSTWSISGSFCVAGAAL